MTEKDSGFTASGPARPEIVNRRLKAAPNLKYQPRDKYTETIIFAGADAWTHAKAWQEANPIGDTVPPVILGPAQLAALASLRIIDKGRRSARVCRAGALDELHLSALASRLALAGVKEARLYSESHELMEDWTAQLARLKQEAQRGDSVDTLIQQAEGKPAFVDELAPCVEARADGLYYVTPKIDKQSGEVTRPGQWLCDPLDVAGVGADDTERFLVLRWRPTGARDLHTEAIPARDI
ncbi:DNA primase, partial [Cronobacter dublinensis]